MAVVDFDNQKHFIQKERIKKRGKEKRYRVYMYIYITAKKRKKKNYFSFFSIFNGLYKIHF